MVVTIAITTMTTITMTTMTMKKLGPCCSNDNVIIKALAPSKTSGISEKAVGTFKNLGPTIGTLRLGL